MGIKSRSQWFSRPSSGGDDWKNLALLLETRDTGKFPVAPIIGIAFYPSRKAIQQHVQTGGDPESIEQGQMRFQSWPEAVQWLKSNGYKAEGRPTKE
jgi:hypothetical protein